MSDELDEWREILAGDEPLRHRRKTAKRWLAAESQRAELQDELEKLRLEFEEKAEKRTKT